MDIRGKIQDTIVKKAISRIISESNSKIDFDYLISSIGSVNDTNKKLVVRITDMNENVGLGIQEGKMVEVSKVTDPDTIFSMDKNTFSNIILNKVDSGQAFLMGAIQSDGKNWLRDSILLEKVFKEIKRVIHAPKGE